MGQGECRIPLFIRRLSLNTFLLRQPSRNAFKGFFMDTDRREFLERLAIGTAALAGAPLSTEKLPWTRSRPLAASSDTWDLSWVDKVNGKYRAVFDSPGIDSGGGVVRAHLWRSQYAEVLGVDPKTMSPVIVLRAKGIVLAMSQPFWDKYSIGKEKNVTDLLTEQPTDKNPVLASSARGEIPAFLDPYMLPAQMAKGTVVLACNLAFDEVVQTVVEKTKQTEEAARKEALAAMVPGVILQPSGVFAVMRAQDAGCKYLRAS
jgi:hypothetical protein